MPEKITCPVCSGNSHGNDCSRCDGDGEILQLTKEDWTELCDLESTLASLLNQLASKYDEYKWPLLARGRRAEAVSLQQQAEYSAEQMQYLIDPNEN